MISKTQILEREKRWTLVAGIASVAAVAIYFIGQLVGQSGVGVNDGAADYLDSVPAHEGSVLFGGILQGLGAAALAIPLVFLFFAALARSDRMRRGLIFVTVVGPLFLGLGSIASTVTAIKAADQWQGTSDPAVVKCLEDSKDDADGGEAKALTEDQKTDCLDDAASDLRSDQGLTGLAVGLSIAGAFGFLVGLMYTSLHAMRTGLLSRFWGSLGMAVGVLLIFPVLNYIALAWFIYLGLLFAGWVPGGRPPAWAAGKAVPWPVPGSMDRGEENVIEGTAEEVDTSAEEVDPAAQADAMDEPQGERRKRKKRNG